MSNSTSLVSCHCGKSFKDSQALTQHTHDSPRHRQSTLPLPPVPGDKSILESQEALQQHQRDFSLRLGTNTVVRTSWLKCSCGKTVKDENGLKQHMRVSSRHRKLKKLCEAAANKKEKNFDGFPDDNMVDASLLYHCRHWCQHIPAKCRVRGAESIANQLASAMTAV
jgi:hypothetical protein